MENYILAAFGVVKCATLAVRKYGEEKIAQSYRSVLAPDRVITLKIDVPSTSGHLSTIQSNTGTIFEHNLIYRQ